LCITFFSGLICGIVAFLAYPRLSLIPLVLLVVPLLLLAWSVYLVLGLRFMYRTYRTVDTYVVTLSEDDLSFRDSNSEWRTRWRPDFEILVTPRFLIIRCGKLMTVGIPRKSFTSPETEDEFVRAARLFQAAATGRTTDELKGGPLEEV